MLNPALGERAGVGHYTKELVDHLIPILKKGDELVLFFDQRMPDAVLTTYAKHKQVRVKRFPLAKYKKYLPFGYSHVVVAQALAREKLDVFHAPAYIIPYQYKGKSVVTIHDLAIYAHPEWFPSKQKFSTDVLVPRSIKKSERVIAVSQATARSVLKQFRVLASGVVTIYEGVNTQPKIFAATAKRILEEKSIGKKYLLFIGTIEPRKNIDQLIKAFDQAMHTLGESGDDVQLVLAGGKGWNHEGIFRTIANADYSTRVRYVGYISDEEKTALLKNAMLFVFPSLWEGFGLPVLEAQAAGIPVITSNVSSLPEVGGRAAVYCDPKSVTSLSKALVSVIRSKAKRTAMSAAGKKHAATFSWTRCAKETYQVYKELYAQE